jgi:hypothetical protein
MGAKEEEPVEEISLIPVMRASLFARHLSRAARADGEDSRRELTAGGACVT